MELYSYNRWETIFEKPEFNNGKDLFSLKLRSNNGAESVP